MQPGEGTDVPGSPAGCRTQDLGRGFATCSTSAPLYDTAGGGTRRLSYKTAPDVSIAREICSAKLLIVRGGRVSVRMDALGLVHAFINGLRTYRGGDLARQLVIDDRASAQLARPRIPRVLIIDYRDRSLKRPAIEGRRSDPFEPFCGADGIVLSSHWHHPNQYSLRG